MQVSGEVVVRHETEAHQRGGELSAVPRWYDIRRGQLLRGDQRAPAREARRGVRRRRGESASGWEVGRSVLLVRSSPSFQSFILRKPRPQPANVSSRSAGVPGPPRRGDSKHRRARALLHAHRGERTDESAWVKHHASGAANRIVRASHASVIPVSGPSRHDLVASPRSILRFSSGEFRSDAPFTAPGGTEVAKIPSDARCGSARRSQSAYRWRWGRSTGSSGVRVGRGGGIGFRAKNDRAVE